MFYLGIVDYIGLISHISDQETFSIKIPRGTLGTLQYIHTLIGSKVLELTSARDKFIYGIKIC